MNADIDRLKLPAETVLILGAGLAGLFLALRLAPRPSLVLASSPPGEAASSAWAQGGVAAALSKDDTPDEHLADTIAAGDGLVDAAAARALCEDGPALVRYLAELGAPFDRDAEGEFILNLEAAHSRARVARVGGDQAGAAIIATVSEAARAQGSIEFMFGWRAVSLIQREDGRAGGVLCADRSGRALALEANETAMALGGVGGLFAVTTNPTGARGDAVAMGARIGATVADPEFVQFHPTAIDVGVDPAPLATEALRGAGAVLIDRHGERLLPDDLAPRDLVARAVHVASQSERGAFLDARAAVGDAFPQAFPTVYATCVKAGLDPRSAPIPVAPAAHYHMGGVATDKDGRTSVPGLWAFGECASTGAHGANRLASNSLLEALVTPARAAERLRELDPPAYAPAGVPEAPQRPQAEALVSLRAAMARHAGVARDAAGLTTLIEELERLAKAYGPFNAALSARFIATGALLREESRGAHARSDFPAKSEPAQHSFLRLDRDGDIVAAPAPHFPPSAVTPTRAI